ncbi:MAG: Pre-mRNA-splicing factor cwc26 [Candelina mexicana]|nr:MAG: Pre-mRNA-splicing factor cwc26 [Candelina mexicana]
MALADYLAKTYLSADPKPSSKSKKRKRKPGESGLTIADDDARGWDTNTNNNNKDNEDGPLTVNSTTASFRRNKTSSWRTIGAPAPSNTDQAAADALIASAAADQSALIAADDDAPSVIEPPKMESGAHAGLQSAAQVTAALAKRNAEERKRFDAEGDAHSGRNSETIYRDASGRIINVAMKRAEARREAEALAAKKEAEIEAQKGDVQVAQVQRKKEELKEAKYMGVARYSDDEALNEELKSQERWNDPAAGFLENKREEGRSVSGKQLYKGASMPNRYGIMPGYRWDGVDRGNGFEKEWFGVRNRRANVRDLEYAWQMDE